jgi:hypothetical protein
VLLIPPSLSGDIRVEPRLPIRRIALRHFSIRAVALVLVATAVCLYAAEVSAPLVKAGSVRNATAAGQVQIGEPIMTVLFKKGDRVPGRDATFERFGLPSTNDAGSVAFRARIVSAEGARAVIYGPQSDGADGVLVTSGENAPANDGTPTGLTFANFRHPLLNDVGAIAFLATVLGEGVDASNDAGVWTNEGGLLRLVAREGDAAPGVSGAVFAHFVSVALGDGAYAIEEDNVAPPAVAFVAQLEAGRGGVTAANDLGLWIYKRGHDPLLRLLLREGSTLPFRTDEAFPGKTVLSFIALQPMPGAAGHGHGVGFSRHSWAHDEVLARVKFTDGTQAIAEFRIGPDFSVQAVAKTGEPTEFKSFSVPTQSFDGQNAYIAKFHVAPVEELGPITPSAVYVANDLDGPSVHHIVSAGDPLPENNEASFGRFQNVVNNGHGSYAFLATVAGTGIISANDTGIWRSAINGIVPLVREGSPAPGIDNAIFREFLSLAMPDNGRAIVKAKARNESTLERTLGIWFTNEGFDGDANTLKLLVRQGGSIAGTSGGPLQSFSALEYVSGSPTQARSFNNIGDFIFRATFADGSQALVKANLP